MKETLIASLSADLVLDLTTRLVAIPSRNPPGEEKACAEFIHATLDSWGIESELVHEPDPERPQVVAKVRGAATGPVVILNGHMDTVGEGEHEKWQTSPFQAVLRGQRLYGLGTCDMKGSLAVGMAIMKALHDSGAQLPGTLMFEASMGEEMAEDGTRTLLKRGYTGDFAIVLEPTNLRIAPATRGAAWYKITLTGPSVHCGLAYPDSPDLMRQLALLEAAISEYHQRISRQTHALLLNPGCRITQIQAGSAHNSLLGHCELTVDRRMLPPERYQQVTEELEGILAGLKETDPLFDYQVEFLRGNEPVEIPPDSRLVTVLGKNLEALTGAQPELWGPPFGSDVRNFIYDCGIPAVNFGAGDFRVCHQPNEFVPFNDLMTCGKVVMGAVVDLLGL